MTRVPARCHHPPELPKRTIAGDVEDDVVPLPALGDVRCGVVDDLVGAERPDEIDLARAAHPGDVRPERLGDLHRVRPHATARADDERPLARLHAALLPHCLEGRDGGRRQRRRLLEGQTRRLRGAPVHPDGGVLGEGAVAGAEHLVALPERGDLLPHRLHDARHVHPDHRVAGLTDPEGETAQVGQPGHDVPHTAVDPGRPYPYQHLPRLDRRLLHVPELEGLGRAVGAPQDRLHGGSPSDSS